MLLYTHSHLLSDFGAVSASVFSGEFTHNDSEGGAHLLMWACAQAGRKAAASSPSLEMFVYGKKGGRKSRSLVAGCLDPLSLSRHFRLMSTFHHFFQVRDVKEASLVACFTSHSFPRTLTSKPRLLLLPPHQTRVD